VFIARISRIFSVFLVQSPYERWARERKKDDEGNERKKGNVSK
jgi:hypothetical protein